MVISVKPIQGQSFCGRWAKRRGEMEETLLKNLHKWSFYFLIFLDEEGEDKGKRRKRITEVNIHSMKPWQQNWKSCPHGEKNLYSEWMHRRVSIPWKRAKIRQMFKEVKGVTSIFQPTLWVLKDENSQVWAKWDELIRGWGKYCGTWLKKCKKKKKKITWIGMSHNDNWTVNETFYTWACHYRGHMG